MNTTVSVLLFFFASFLGYCLAALLTWWLPNWHDRREIRRIAAHYSTLPVTVINAPRPEDSTAVNLCDVRAVPCVYHDPVEKFDCERTPHDHVPCQFPRGHDGRHSWVDIPWAEGVATVDPHAPVPVTFAMPPAPAAGRHVRDREGVIWLIRLLDDIPVAHTGEKPVRTIRWASLLADHGPVTLIDLTPDELLDEELYGPIGMRWGDPATPCPYRDLDAACLLGVGHAGPHRGEHGDILGANSIVDGPINTSPKQSAAEPCNCGRPDQHRPTCNRYRRVSHRPTLRGEGEE